MTRMFVAALPPSDVVDDLDEFLSSRREFGVFRWSPPEHWHLTLAFMESVPDRALDDLVERLTVASRRRRPMAAYVAGGGAFPHPDRGRVLYARLEQAEAEGIEQLAAGARAAAAKAGASPDGQRFRPHLTLARLGRPESLTRWVRLLDGFRSPAWHLDEIALVASYLGEGPRRRPRHEILDTFTLGTG